MATISLSEKAYQHIRQQVFSGDLEPGARLVNRTLAEELGTSFIPVREAISRLASEGVVEQVAGAGAFVKKFDRQEISEIYDVRELFEPYAAGQAARFMTDHEISGLDVIMKEWNALGETILNRKRGPSTADQERWLELNEKFHDLMITGSRNRLLSKITSDVHVLSLCFSAHRGSPKLLSEKLIKSTLNSHNRLLALLRNHDSSGAAMVVKEQLKFGRESVLNFFDQNQ